MLISKLILTHINRERVACENPPPAASFSLNI